MKLLGIIWLIAIGWCACSESVKEQLSYTEKDIEGYWAVYTTLHPSVLGDRFANRTDSIEVPILRFYNTINGVTDSTYYISGDSVFVIEYDGWGANDYHFALKYRILFVSKERIELWQLSTGQFITYYSLLSLPIRNPLLEKLELNPLCDEGFRMTSDSIVSTIHTDCFHGCYFGIRPMIQSKCDPQQYSRMAELYRRIDLRTVMLENTHNSGLPAPAGSMLGMQSEERLDYLNISHSQLDPCLLAINRECAEVMKWIYVSGK